MLNTVIRQLDSIAKEYPDKTAVSTDSVGIFFIDYKIRARKVGAAVIAHTGLFNRPVAIYMKKSEKELIAMMGVLYSANYYVPLAYDSPPERLSRMLKVLEDPFVITDSESLPGLSTMVSKDRILLFEELSGYEGGDTDGIDERLEEIIDTDPAYVIFTSGSTGEPKGVVVPHRAVIDFVTWWIERFGFDNHTVFANQAPFHFDLSMPDVFTPLFTGGRTHILDERKFMSPVKLIDEMNRAGVNALNWAPSAMMLFSGLRVFSKADFEKLETVIFIGEPMPVKHLNYWRKYHPDTVFVNMYGPTETAYASAYYVVDREFSEDDMLPIGRACGNERVVILDEHGKMIREPGVTGEICIMGSCLAKGYFGLEHEAFSFFPEQTCYREPMYHTGDLGRYNERNEMVCLGRKDSQIKHMGYRIDLGEIEAGAAGIPGIRSSFAAYDKKKSRILLFYEADECVDRALVTEGLGKRIPAYMLPADYIRFDRMPLNINGKTDRSGIIRQYIG